MVNAGLSYSYIDREVGVAESVISTGSGKVLSGDQQFVFTLHVYLLVGQLASVNTSSTRPSTCATMATSKTWFPC